MDKGTELGSGGAGVNKMNFSQRELTQLWGGPQGVHRARPEAACRRQSSRERSIVVIWRVASLRR